MGMNQAPIAVLLLLVPAMYSNMTRKASIDLSFSMIFAIIIIVVVIAVGFYMVSYFLSLKNCSELGLFRQSLQTSINEAWRSDEALDLFEGRVPGSVDSICFGSLSEGKDTEEYRDLRQYDEPGINLFFHPLPSGRCDIQYGSLEHVRFNGFVCLPVENGRVDIRLVKNSFDGTVLVCDPDDVGCKLTPIN